MYKVYFDPETELFREEEVDKETWEKRHELTGDKPWFWVGQKKDLNDRIEQMEHDLENGVVEIIKCKDCGNDFMLKAREIKWYDTNGFQHPKRCLACRKKRKSEKEQG